MRHAQFRPQQADELIKRETIADVNLDEVGVFDVGYPGFQNDIWKLRITQYYW